MLFVTSILTLLFGSVVDSFSGILLPTTFNIDRTVGTQFVNPSDGTTHYSNQFNIKQTIGYGQRSVFCGGRMFVTGGFDQVPNANAIVHDTVQVFYPKENVTRVASPMRVARAFHSVVCRANQLIVCGGVNSSYLAVHSCEKYDLVQDRWAPMLVSMPARVAYHQAAYVNHSATIDRMYILGGLDALVKNSLSTVFYYDFIDNIWVSSSGVLPKVRPMKQSRYSFGLAVIDSQKIRVCGGGFYNQTASLRYSLSQCESLNTATIPALQNWMLKSPLLGPRSDFGMVQSGSEVYVVGGACTNTTQAPCTPDTKANGMKDTIEVIEFNLDKVTKSEWTLAHAAIVPSAINLV